MFNKYTLYITNQKIRENNTQLTADHCHMGPVSATKTILTSHQRNGTGKGNLSGLEP